LDVVQRPATTNSFFESEDVSMKKTTLKQLIEGLDASHWMRPLLEDDMGTGAVPDMPIDVPAEGSSDDQIKAAFRSMVTAAFDDEKLDSKATLARIKDVLNAYDKLTASDKKGGGDAPAAKDKATPTVESLQAKLDRMEAESAVRDLLVSANVASSPALDLLESANVASSPALVKALVPLTESERKSLVDLQPKRTAGATPRQPQPRSVGPQRVVESVESYDAEDSKDLFESCRR
jgi:hypothetical protein